MITCCRPEHMAGVLLPADLPVPITVVVGKNLLMFGNWSPTPLLNCSTKLGVPQFPNCQETFHEMVILTSTRCIRRLWLDSGCWIGIKDISHLLIPINDGLLLLCFWSSNHLKGEELVDVDGLGVASSRLKPETRSVGQSRLQARNIKGHLLFVFVGVF